MLPAERAKCSFDIAKLRQLVVGGRKEMVDSFKPMFQGAPFDDVGMKDYWSYEERFTRTLERTSEAILRIRDPKNRKFLLNHMKGRIAMVDMFETGALGIHFSMFLTFIKTNASKEQQELWLGPAQEAKFFGAYAQTELGHGSNVRGLETIATFDRETDEFVILSPTLTSLKWWPTGMYACTHGAVFAQLVIDGKNYGVHAFMVQFRDDKGCLMPGVEVGEMGPKINADNSNIGYARFTNVRVPRFNMFAKFQQVTREGQYVPAPRKLNKFRYISMMSIRMHIVAWSYLDLAKAACIAVRYSCVRKQGFIDTTAADPMSSGVGENVVMDYKVQQYRLFKALSIAYCFLWSSRYVKDYLGRVQDTITMGTDEERDAAADEMPELHATLCGLKVWSTLWAHAGIEDCRKACGGQGYLRSSGVCDLSGNFAEPATVEGEQVIMSLQVARFLIKSVGDLEEGRPVVGSVAYLKDAPMAKVSVSSFKGQTALLLDLMKDRANRYAKKLAKAFQNATSTGLGFDAALNSVAILAYKVAEIHSAYVFARNNYLGISPEKIEDNAIRPVLFRLLDFVMLTQLQDHAGDWMGVLDDATLDLVDTRINELLQELRPDAVGLADGLGFTDDDLKSTLGRYDGNVYEAIYGEAKMSPLNASPRMVAWEHLEKVIDKDFLRESMKHQRVAASKL